MNENKEFFKVLWVEDDPEVTKPLPRRAEKQWIDLRPFPCWDDAQDALTKDFDSWDAIILDAKCKHHRDSLDNAAEFLREALMEIRAICREKGRQLNWYILTGEGGAETKSINEHIPDERMKWDGDWTEQTGKKFYSKTTEEIDSLFMRVKYHATQSERTQIKTQLYREVFEALDYLGIKPYTENALSDILFAIHFPTKDRNFKAVLHYTPMRQLLEYLFRACNKFGLVPDQCMDKGRVNLNQSYMYLIGKDADVVGVRYGNDGDRIASPQIENEIRAILCLGNVNSHTVDLNDEDKKKIEELFRTANSKFVLFSLVFQLCDVIVWLKDYVASHGDKAVNLSKCKMLEKDDRAKYEGKEFYPEKDENGFWHCEDCSVLIKPFHVGEKVRLRDVRDNTDIKTKHKYKYFAYYDVV